MDLTAVRPPRLILAEVKSPWDRLTPDQREWLAQLAQVPGIEVYLWYPKDWQTIVQVLQRKGER